MTIQYCINIRLLKQNKTDIPSFSSVPESQKICNRDFFKSNNSLLFCAVAITGEQNMTSNYRLDADRRFPTLVGRKDAKKGCFVLY